MISKHTTIRLIIGFTLVRAAETFCFLVLSRITLSAFAQDPLRNGYADLLRDFRIDYQIKHSRSVDSKSAASRLLQFYRPSRRRGCADSDRKCKQRDGKQEADKILINAALLPFSCCFLPCARCLLSSNHPIRPCQHVRRNCETDLFGCLEIDYKLELGWLLYREIRRLRTLEDFIYVERGAAE